MTKATNDEELWATPKALDDQRDRMSDEAMRREIAREGAGQGLPLDVRFWPTPTAKTGSQLETDRNTGGTTGGASLPGVAETWEGI